MSTQGYESNHSGRFLEEVLRRELASRGFIFRHHSDDGGNLDLFNPRVVVMNSPYTNLAEGVSRSEFVITDGNRKIRVECKWQSGGGSCDEKLYWLMGNAQRAMPENEILILWGGSGFRARFIKLMEKEAKQTLHKKIHVININEVVSWVKRELIHKIGAAA